ncbi:hypothetical protein [Nocardia sp. NPDC056000]|uniref:hypothetical protein n=1 Tax=Nocardia sp. NPDC056000 TaxID=3345674 RepID=UPI0035D82086
MTTSRVRGAKLAATAVAGLGAVLLATAPNAAAADYGAVTLDGSSAPQAGCSYTLTSGDIVGGGSSSTNSMPITFSDNGAVIGTGKVGGLIPSPAKVTWTPKTAGQHVLTATGGWGSDWITLAPLTVQVRASAATGSFGCPLPSISG